MNNRDVTATWQYHDGTKHSPQSVYASQHFLDWANRPLPYKIYQSLESLSLPTDFPPSTVSALDVIGSPSEASEGERLPDLTTLARLCLLSNGITKRRRYAGGEIQFRAAACTGALYHIELYLVCGDLEGLGPGVYHYGAHDHALRRLRAGDFRQVLVEASGGERSIKEAVAVIICTTTFWRNAWKYQARAYRHSFWDNGTILANLLAVATAAHVPASLVLGFADQAVNRLIDVDPNREAAISLVALGRTPDAPPPAPPVDPLGLPIAPLSRTEIDYPAIRAMHAASSLASGHEVAAWRKHGCTSTHQSRLEPSGQLIPLQRLEPTGLSEDPIEAVIRRRGSTRRFLRAPIGFGQLSEMLERASGSIQADCLDQADGPLSDLYLIANDVDGLRPGTYVLHRDKRALETLQAGNLREAAERLDLGQELAGDASANVYFLVELNRVLERFGNRGYRVAQLAAAISAGRLYLAAYALRLGATGLTFFDDDVTAFFSPHGARKSVMFLMALGRPAARMAG